MNPKPSTNTANSRMAEIANKYLNTTQSEQSRRYNTSTEILTGDTHNRTLAEQRDGMRLTGEQAVLQYDTDLSDFTNQTDDARELTDGRLPSLGHKLDYREIRAQNQTTGELWGKALMNTLGTVVGETITTAGSLLSLPDIAIGSIQALVSDKTMGDVMSDVFEGNTLLSNLYKPLMDAGNAIQSEVEDAFHITQTNAARNGFAFTDGTWWATNAPSIVSSLASMVVPIGAAAGTAKLVGSLGKQSLKWIGSANKAVQIAGKAGKGVTNALTSGFAEKAWSTAYSAHADTFMEIALGYNDKVAEFESMGLSKEEANRMAGEWAGESYKYGIPTSLLFNAASVNAMLKKGRRWTKQDYDIQREVSKNIRDRARGTATGQLNIQLPNVSKTAKVLTGIHKAVTPMIGEGFQEMSIDIALEEGMRNTLEINDMLSESDSASTLTDRLGNYLTDGHMWTTFFFGALGGGLGSIVTRKLFNGTSSADADKQAMNLISENITNMNNTLVEFATRTLESNVDNMTGVYLDDRIDPTKPSLKTPVHDIAQMFIRDGNGVTTDHLKSMLTQLNGLTDSEISTYVDSIMSDDTKLTDEQKQSLSTQLKTFTSLLKNELSTLSDIQKMVNKDSRLLEYVGVKKDMVRYHMLQQMYSKDYYNRLSRSITDRQLEDLNNNTEYQEKLKQLQDADVTDIFETQSRIHEYEIERARINMATDEDLFAARSMVAPTQEDVILLQNKIKQLDKSVKENDVEFKELNKIGGITSEDELVKERSEELLKDRQELAVSTQLLGSYKKSIELSKLSEDAISEYIKEKEFIQQSISNRYLGLITIQEAKLEKLLDSKLNLEQDPNNEGSTISGKTEEQVNTITDLIKDTLSIRYAQAANDTAVLNYSKYRYESANAYLDRIGTDEFTQSLDKAVQTYEQSSSTLTDLNTIKKIRRASTNINSTKALDAFIERIPKEQRNDDRVIEVIEDTKKRILLDEESRTFDDPFRKIITDDDGNIESIAMKDGNQQIADTYIKGHSYSNDTDYYIIDDLYEKRVGDTTKQYAVLRDDTTDKIIMDLSNKQIVRTPIYASQDTISENESTIESVDELPSPSPTDTVEGSINTSEPSNDISQPSDNDIADSISLRREDKSKPNNITHIDVTDSNGNLKTISISDKYVDENGTEYEYQVPYFIETETGIDALVRTGGVPKRVTVVNYNNESSKPTITDNDQSVEDTRTIEYISDDTINTLSNDKNVSSNEHIRYLRSVLESLNEIVNGISRMSNSGVVSEDNFVRAMANSTDSLEISEQVDVFMNHFMLLDLTNTIHPIVISSDEYSQAEKDIISNIVGKTNEFTKNHSYTKEQATTKIKAISLKSQVITGLRTDLSIFNKLSDITDDTDISALDDISVYELIDGKSTKSKISVSDLIQLRNSLFKEGTVEISLYKTEKGYKLYAPITINSKTRLIQIDHINTDNLLVEGVVGNKSAFTSTAMKDFIDNLTYQDIIDLQSLYTKINRKSNTSLADIGIGTIDNKRLLELEQKILSIIVSTLPSEIVDSNNTYLKANGKPTAKAIKSISEFIKQFIQSNNDNRIGYLNHANEQFANNKTISGKLSSEHVLEFTSIANRISSNIINQHVYKTRYIDSMKVGKSMELYSNNKNKPSLNYDESSTGIVEYNPSDSIKERIIHVPSSEIEIIDIRHLSEEQNMNPVIAAKKLRYDKDGKGGIYHTVITNPNGSSHTVPIYRNTLESYGDKQELVLDYLTFVFSKIIDGARGYVAKSNGTSAQTPYWKDDNGYVTIDDIKSDLSNILNATDLDITIDNDLVSITGIQGLDIKIKYYKDSLKIDKITINNTSTIGNISSLRDISTFVQSNIKRVMGMIQRSIPISNQGEITFGHSLRTIPITDRTKSIYESTRNLKRIIPVYELYAIVNNPKHNATTYSNSKDYTIKTDIFRTNINPITSNGKLLTYSSLSPTYRHSMMLDTIPTVPFLKSTIYEVFSEYSNISVLLSDIILKSNKFANIDYNIGIGSYSNLLALLKDDIFKNINFKATYIENAEVKFAYNPTTNTILYNTNYARDYNPQLVLSGLLHESLHSMITSAINDISSDLKKAVVEDVSIMIKDISSINDPILNKYISKLFDKSTITNIQLLSATEIYNILSKDNKWQELFTYALTDYQIASKLSKIPYNNSNSQIVSSNEVLNSNEILHSEDIDRNTVKGNWLQRLARWIKRLFNSKSKSNILNAETTDNDSSNVVRTVVDYRLDNTIKSKAKVIAGSLGIKVSENTLLSSIIDILDIIDGNIDKRLSIPLVTSPTIPSSGTTEISSIMSESNELSVNLSDSIETINVTTDINKELSHSNVSKGKSPGVFYVTIGTAKYQIVQSALQSNKIVVLYPIENAKLLDGEYLPGTNYRYSVNNTSKTADINDILLLNGNIYFQMNNGDIYDITNNKVYNEKGNLIYKPSNVTGFIQNDSSTTQTSEQSSNPPRRRSTRNRNTDDLYIEDLDTSNDNQLHYGDTSIVPLGRKSGNIQAASISNIDIKTLSLQVATDIDSFYIYANNNNIFLC